MRALGRTLRLTHVVVSDGFAGTERYVCDVARELASRGHDVHVVGGAHDAMPRVLGGTVRWSPGGSTWEALAALRGGRRDVVHSHLTKAEFVGLVAAPLTRGHRLSTRHILAPRGHGRPARAVGRLVRSSLWAEVAVSEYVAARVRPPSEVVLLNGTAVVPDDRGATPSSSGPPTVLVAHRLEDEKHTDVALRAWALSGLAGRGWRLGIAGRGPQRAPLERLAAELGVAASVDFLGWVSDVPALMRSSSVFLATAPAEPCGLSVLEAMAHGLPVVAADGGGHRETVGTAEEPQVFPVGDPGASAARLVALAEDDDLRARYGARLREVQRARFSIETHVDGLEALYRRAVLGQPVPS